MASPLGLIDELEQAISNGDIARRAKALRLVADLFELGSGRFSDEHIALFDQIMQCLVSKIETSARASFGSFLASLPDAPCGVIRVLAFDSAIEVAGAVLSRSTRIEQADLILGARTLSQSHLLAISERADLSDKVTDVLLERGNHAVARCAAQNTGASFSVDGYAALVDRSRDDVDLALSVWARPGLPRMSLVKLFVEASEAVQQRFEADDPGKSSVVRQLVARASHELLRQTRAGSPAQVDALEQVEALSRSGKLEEARLVEFAELGDFDKTTIALSKMCDLPIELVERVLVKNNHEQLLVLAKAANLTWETTKAVLILSVLPEWLDPDEIERAFITYTRLKLKTATTAVDFYRLRERATSSTFA
jgi:uncharacterized protein (DUF2336 family)